MEIVCQIIIVVLMVNSIIIRLFLLCFFKIILFYWSYTFFILVFSSILLVILVFFLSLDIVSIIFITSFIKVTFNYEIIYKIYLNSRSCQYFYAAVLCLHQEQTKDREIKKQKYSIVMYKFYLKYNLTWKLRFLKSSFLSIHPI